MTRFLLTSTQTTSSAVSTATSQTTHRVTPTPVSCSGSKKCSKTHANPQKSFLSMVFSMKMSITTTPPGLLTPLSLKTSTNINMLSCQMTATHLLARISMSITSSSSPISSRRIFSCLLPPTLPRLKKKILLLSPALPLWVTPSTTRVIPLVSSLKIFYLHLFQLNLIIKPFCRCFLSFLPL